MAEEIRNLIAQEPLQRRNSNRIKVETKIIEKNESGRKCGCNN